MKSSWRSNGAGISLEELTLPGGIVFPTFRLMIIAAGLVIAAGLYYLVNHTRDVFLPVCAFLVQQFRDAFVGQGLAQTKGQVFQFPLQMANPKAMSQGCINLEDFFGEFQTFLLIVLNRAPNGTGSLSQF